MRFSPVEGQSTRLSLGFKARIFIGSLVKGRAQKRACFSIQLVKQSALTLINQTECNVDSKVKKYGVESLAQPDID